MGVTYNLRQARGFTIVDLCGRITSGETSTPGTGVLLHELIRDLLKQGHNNILLNLRDVTHLDSAGIGQLFGCFTTVQRQNGILKLSNPNERVRNVLQLTRLNTVVEVMEDESIAVQSSARAA